MAYKVTCDCVRGQPVAYEVTCGRLHCWQPVANEVTCGRLHCWQPVAYKVTCDCVRGQLVAYGVTRGCMQQPLGNSDMSIAHST